MKNPIPHSGMFVTPTSEQDLYDRIEQLTGSERALAFQIAMYTFNLCHKMVAEELRKDVNWNDYISG
jgi:hypothetical protein